MKLKKIENQVRQCHSTCRSIIQTGGNAEQFVIKGAIIDHSLTLDGLALASSKDNDNDI